MYGGDFGFVVLNEINRVLKFFAVAGIGVWMT